MAQPNKNRPSRVWLMPQAIRYLGLKWLLGRAWYWLQLKLRLLEWRTPCKPRAAAAPFDASRLPPFFLDQWDRARAREILAAFDDDSPPDEGAPPSVAAANRLKRRVITLFSKHEVELPLTADGEIDWHANPISGERFPENWHWSRIGDFAGGDIKAVWEPSRFAFAFALVRAYWRTGTNDYPEMFWRWFESWVAANPPNTGVNWKCGQEASLRAMAWIFALYGFRDAPASTPPRIGLMMQLLEETGRRVAANIGYALSQKNNHGISEAAGLWTIGHILRDQPVAAKWRKTGRRQLEKQCRELIYEDGGFSQHSVNYQRHALDVLSWCVRLGQCCGEPLSNAVSDALFRSWLLSFELQDEETGGLPNIGANDGSLVLPLTNCDYSDFRPSIAAAAMSGSSVRLDPPGPWHEALFWLFGPNYTEAEADTPHRMDSGGPSSGFHAIRGQETFAVMRAARFRHRPSDADQLHVDLWWRGLNIAMDPGTYSYNAEPPWDYALKATEFHNTVTVDGRSQMEKASRFLWLPWAQATLLRPVVRFAWIDEGVTAKFDPSAPRVWQASHNGYERLNPPVTHSRTVALDGDVWTITDDLECRQSREYRLHWLLGDWPFTRDVVGGKISLRTPRGEYTLTLAAFADDARAEMMDEAEMQVSVVRGDASSPRGWQSRYYLDRQPAISLAAVVRARSVRFVSTFRPPKTV